MKHYFDHYLDDYFKEPKEDVPDGIYTHDILTDQECGKQIDIATYYRILQSRAELDRKQVIMEDLLSPFGIELSKESDIIKLDLVTGEVEKLLTYKRSKMNPYWQAKQARDNRKEFIHFLSDGDIPLSELHYFTMPACDQRYHIGTNLRPHIDKSRRRLSNVQRDIKRKYGENADFLLVALEFTIDQVHGIYLHYNVIIHIKELSLVDSLPAPNRRSIVWSNSGVSFAHRDPALGQFIEFFLKQYRGKSRRYVSYNGPVQDAKHLIEYINKPFDPAPLEGNREAAKWLHDQMSLRNLYQPKGAYKAFRARLKSNKQTVIELSNETHLRQVSDKDFHHAEKKSDDGDRRRDNQGGKNWIVGRMSPAFNGIRYKTPSLLVSNYDDYNPNLSFEERLRLEDIRDLQHKAREAFSENSGNANIKEAMSETSALDSAFIYVTISAPNYSEIVSGFDHDTFDRLMYRDYYLPKLLNPPKPDKKTLAIHDEDIPEHDPGTDEHELTRDLSPEQMKYVRIFHEVFG